ncbi:MAG: hypothetical protein JNK53_04285 [Phycisphaerae bacterium]|nr:hypothetical protein [Phycisphaerae bacterium]
MNRSLASTVILAAGALTCAAGAEVYMGTGGAVADNNAAGSDFTLNVADSLIVSDISVTLTNFRHAYLGHLVATLTHEPTGKSITLFDQVGRTTSSSKGDSSDFHYDYTFADGGSNLWAAAQAAGGSTKLASGTFYASGAGIGSTAAAGPASLSFASTFAGIDAQGTWKLNVSDRASGNTLNNDWSWSMNVTAVPGPGAMALVAAAGFVGTGRRRRS